MKMEESENPAVLSDFCAVCGDKASKWRYSQYGATSCFSCRTFYRRSVESKAFKKYKCRSKSPTMEKCVIDIQSRKKCAFCRYKKCRQVGMRHGQPHWIRDDSADLEIHCQPDEAQDVHTSREKSLVGKIPNHLDTKLAATVKPDLALLAKPATVDLKPQATMTVESHSPVGPSENDKYSVPKIEKVANGKRKAAIIFPGPLQKLINVPKRQSEEDSVSSGESKAVHLKHKDNSDLQFGPKIQGGPKSPELPDHWSLPPRTQVLPQQIHIFSQQPQQGFSPIESSSAVWPELPLDRSFAQSPPPDFVFAPESSASSCDKEGAAADIRLFHSRLDLDDSLTRESEQVRQLLGMGYHEHASHLSQSSARDSDCGLNLNLSFEQSLIRNLLDIDEPQNFAFNNRNTQEYLNQQHQTYNIVLRPEEAEILHTEELKKIPLSFNDPNICFTFEESIRIASLLQIDRDSMVAIRDSMKHMSLAIVKQFMSSVATGRPLEFSALCWGYACGIQKLTRFAMAMPEFCQVTENVAQNKKCLMLHNIDPMFNIRNAFFFQADAPSIICQLERFGIFDVSLLKTFLESFAIGNFPGAVGPMKWKQYFVTPWADSYDQEMKYEYLMSSLHQLKLNHETTCLLSVVALFSTQDLQQDLLTVPLDNIRREQYSFSLLLYRYLVHSRGQKEASKIYPGFLSTLSTLREMSEILKNKTIKIGPSPNIEEHLNFFIGNSD